MALAGIFCITAALLSTMIQAVPVRILIDCTLPPYTLLNRTLGGTAMEVPDCGHPQFGQHITYALDNQLNRQVFAFHIHTNQDDDRCIGSDRQRNEIKTYGQSPAYLKLYQNDIGDYSWNFKLRKSFQATTSFTHIHQQKFLGGDDSDPLYTLTVNKISGGSLAMRFIYYPWNAGQSIVLAQTPLTEFEDTWVHVHLRVAMAHKGMVSIKITRMADRKMLMSYENQSIDNWRDGTAVDFCRPKWGIYRSLNTKNELRDETVFYDRFCLAKAVTRDDFCDQSDTCNGCPIPQD